MVERDLTVLPVRNLVDDDGRFDCLDHRLVRPPFRMVINAPSESGKSVLVQNTIFNDQFYCNDKGESVFDLIVFVSPTVYEDTTTKPMLTIESDKLVVSDDVENLDKIIMDLIEMQTERRDEREHILLVLDDCIGNIPRGSKLNTFIMKARQWRISIIICTQYYKGIDPKIRENTNAYIFFLNQSLSEVDKIRDEVGNKFKNFDKYYEYATNEPYSFLFVNVKKGRLYKKFDELLVDKLEKFYKPMDGK